MNFKSIAVCAFFAMMLVSCGPSAPVLDLSTDESATASVDKIVQTVPASEQETFKKQIAALMFFKAVSVRSSDQDVVKAEVKKVFQGKNAAQLKVMIEEMKNKLEKSAPKQQDMPAL